MTAPQVTTYTGTIPVRSQDQTTFSNNTSDLLTWWPTSVVEMNVVSTFVNSQAEAAEISANLADTAVTSVNFKGNYSNLSGALNVPASVYHSGKYWQLLNNMADVTTESPSVGATNWALATQSAGRVPIDTPATLSVSGRYFVSGDGIVTLPDPATLPDGFGFDIAKNGSDTPTISVGTSKVKSKLGFTDGVILDVPQLEFTVKSGVYEV